MSSQTTNISFSGCGFLGIYHVGVASALREYAPQLLVSKIAGASAGAIAACCLLCDCCLGQCTTDVLQVVTQARSTVLGPMHPSFRLNKILRDGLRKNLPQNAHELASGRLFISLTRFSDGENVLISQFDTREELIQALICSAFIPFYSGTVPPTLKGVRYIDGGWSDNCPSLTGGQTITVSPFDGESDICPADLDSASYLLMQPQKISVGGKPLNPCSKDHKCQRKGLKDELGLINYEYWTATEGSECEECMSRIEIAPQKGLPPQVRKNLAKAEAVENGWIRTLLSYRPIKWARYAMLPFSLPWDMTYQICIRILEWLPNMPKDAQWLVYRMTAVLRFVLKQINASSGHYLLSSGSSGSRYTCQLSLTEMNLGSSSGMPVSDFTTSITTSSVGNGLDSIDVDSNVPGPSSASAPIISANSMLQTEENEMDFGFSCRLPPDQRSAVEILANAVNSVSIANDEYEQRPPPPSDSVVNAAEDLELAGLAANAPADSDMDIDGIASILEYTRRHDALVSYYYTEKDKIQVCEIFGVEGVDAEEIHEAMTSRKPSFRDIEEEDGEQEDRGLVFNDQRLEADSSSLQTSSLVESADGQRDPEQSQLLARTSSHIPDDPMTGPNGISEQSQPPQSQLQQQQQQQQQHSTKASTPSTTPSTSTVLMRRQSNASRSNASNRQQQRLSHPIMSKSNQMLLRTGGHSSEDLLSSNDDEDGILFQPRRPRKRTYSGEQRAYDGEYSSDDGAVGGGQCQN